MCHVSIALFHHVVRPSLPGCCWLTEWKPIALLSSYIPGVLCSSSSVAFCAANFRRLCGFFSSSSSSSSAAVSSASSSSASSASSPGFDVANFRRICRLPLCAVPCACCLLLSVCLSGALLRASCWFALVVVAACVAKQMHGGSPPAFFKATLVEKKFVLKTTV